MSDKTRKEKPPLLAEASDEPKLRAEFKTQRELPTKTTSIQDSKYKTEQPIYQEGTLSTGYGCSLLWKLLDAKSKLFTTVSSCAIAIFTLIGVLAAIYFGITSLKSEESSTIKVVLPTGEVVDTVQKKPYFACIYRFNNNENYRFALEVRPEYGKWSPFFIAIPSGETEKCQPSLSYGPAGIIPTGSAFCSTVEA